MEKLEYISYELKFEGYGRGGCVCKMSSEYKAKEGIEIKEEDIDRAWKGQSHRDVMNKVVEAYLLAHPHAYTWKSLVIISRIVVCVIIPTGYISLYLL